jgi:hypothetical protein
MCYLMLTGENKFGYERFVGRKALVTLDDCSL